MRPVQLLLIVGTAFVLLVYLAYFRSKLTDRLVALVLLSVSWLSILLPEYTTTIANALGVGRGADLILYCFGVFTAFALVLLYTRVTAQSQQITELVRHLAIRDASTPVDLQLDSPQAESALAERQ
jgi:small membrane protein